ncbi:MAG: tRNA (adenosine(37)-N6)-threonylcarbamoyltransferase complex ATPase subunit type 1 TsaE [Magnetococcales bacterium]|nr:tRNA (adenosine(37)-N6)-threonylcarbamoyltransferase complex ATPase subunit type 1 TsaE [Magnetococcales bacterium]
MGSDRAPVSLVSGSEEETERWGGALARGLGPGCVIALHGGLGAGKTAFARGVIRGLGINEPYITSPTFTLVNPYEGGRLPVYHFDLYRLEGPDDLTLMGAESYLEGGGVVLMEWPERADGWLPEDRLVVEIDFGAGGDEERKIHLRALGEVSAAFLEEVRGVHL